MFDPFLLALDFKFVFVKIAIGQFAAPRVKARLIIIGPFRGYFCNYLLGCAFIC